MFDIISYILFTSFLVIVVFYIYIKIKYGFWVIQPVFHIYDISYMISPPGIIRDYLPEKNKYTNFKNIQFYYFDKLPEVHLQRFIHIIQKNYLQNRENTYTPSKNNIVPYFNSHNVKSMISLYTEDYEMVEIDPKKGNKIIQDKKIIGSITTRPIYIEINNVKTQKQNIQFTAYYVDYLCVDKAYRKKGIAPQLIQTHHYQQSHSNKNIVVSLFKREEELTGIIPLCVYSTYGFQVKTWTKPPELSAEYTLLEINPQNLHFLVDFMKENNRQFDIVINTEISNMIELIKTKNIFIYTIMVDDEIICAYFFRKTCIYVEKNIEVLTCFASINNTDNPIFIQGFKISFWKIAAENRFGFSAIENISHNNILIENIMKKTGVFVISPTAYFFYNFAYPTFPSNKVLAIH